MKSVKTMQAKAHVSVPIAQIEVEKRNALGDAWKKFTAKFVMDAPAFWDETPEAARRMLNESDPESTRKPLA
jgi:hypothetical protein